MTGVTAIGGKNQQMTTVITDKLPNPSGESRRDFSSALENQTKLKRSPAIHRKVQFFQNKLERKGKWGKSIKLWQERSIRCPQLAMAQYYSETLG